MRTIAFTYLPEARLLIAMLRALGQPIIAVRIARDPERFVLGTICADAMAVDALAAALACGLRGQRHATALARTVSITEITIGWLVRFVEVPALPVVDRGGLSHIQARRC